MYINSFDTNQVTIKDGTLIDILGPHQTLVSTTARVVYGPSVSNPTYVDEVPIVLNSDGSLKFLCGIRRNGSTLPTKQKRMVHWNNIPIRASSMPWSMMCPEQAVLLAIPHAMVAVVVGTGEPGESS